jgi:hypothetical protein
MTRPYTLLNAIHRDSALSVVLKKSGSDYYLAIEQIRPATPVIINVSTAGAGWTAIATGLTGVLSWKLNERSGRTFRYAFEAAPAAYMTSFGPLQRDTGITEIYVQRPAATDLDMELEIWYA